MFNIQFNKVYIYKHMLPLANLDRKGSTEKISLTYIEVAEMQVQEGFEPEDTESIRIAECFRGKAPLAGAEISPHKLMRDAQLPGPTSSSQILTILCLFSIRKCSKD